MMKIFITVDLSDVDIKNLSEKDKELLEIDLYNLTTNAIEMMKSGLPIQYKITNLPFRYKRDDR